MGRNRKVICNYCLRHISISQIKNHMLFMHLGKHINYREVETDITADVMPWRRVLAILKVIKTDNSCDNQHECLANIKAIAEQELEKLGIKEDPTNRI